MTIKIHHGFILPKFSLNQLHILVLEMRERAGHIHEDLYAKRTAKLCYRILDNHTLLSPADFLKYLKEKDENFKIGYSPASLANFIIQHHQLEIKRTMHRDPDYDYECNMALIPGRGKIYMLFYAEDAAYWEMLKTFQEVKEYPYWNNTDPPDGMTWSRWERRGAEWDKVLSAHRSKIPSLCGFSVALVVTGRVLTDIAQILALIPTLEERAKEHAWDSLMNRVIKELHPGSEIESSDCMGLFFKAQDYLKTDEGKGRLKEEEQRLITILQPVYTKDDLLNRLEDRNPTASTDAKSEDNNNPTGD